MVRIIGIDPGLRNTGWGVIASEGQRLPMWPTARCIPMPMRRSPSACCKSTRSSSPSSAP